MSIDERSDLGVLVSCLTIGDIVAAIILACAGYHWAAFLAAIAAMAGACLSAIIWKGRKP